MKINGVKSISYGMKTISFDGLDNISYGNTADLGVEIPSDLHIEKHFKFEPINAFEGTFTFFDADDSVHRLFATPTYHVKITTRRTPRKMKKTLKKVGKYNKQRTYNIKNANVTASMAYDTHKV